MYKLTQFETILRLSDNACIPFAEGNSDYQQYLAWLNDGIYEEHITPAVYSEEVPATYDDLGNELTPYKPAELISPEVIEKVFIKNEPEPADPIPPATIPDVTPRQIRAALNELGLRDEVEAAVAQSDQTTKDAWEFSTLFVRDYPLTVALGQALNKSSDELDDLFILASTK